MAGLLGGERDAVVPCPWQRPVAVHTLLVGRSLLHLLLLMLLMLFRRHTASQTPRSIAS